LADNQEERSREDLTEEASPYRLEEFRRKGQVAQSREVSALLALLATAVTAYAVSPKMGASMAEFMREVFRTDIASHTDLGSTHALRPLFEKAVKLMVAISLPVCLAGFLSGVAGSLLQVGSIFSFDPLTPSFDKINPLQGLKRMFSLRTVLEAIRLCLKMFLVFLIAYGLIKSEILRAPLHSANDPISLFTAFAQSAKSLFLPLFGILAVFAGADFALQRMEYSKNLRMTKQEAKQEHKEREGDPHIKARIRGIQRDMARKRMMQAVKKADVIITNPTHIAIAIVYDKANMAAPKVVGKGADFVAQKIKQVASEAGVPLVENVPLARTLYKTVKVGQYIPRALYQAVAEVLAYVYRLKRKDFV
jgi:flagellar biosynthetic protein FlhB